MCTFKFGKWICSKEFYNEKPIDLFHKQLDKRDIELPKELQNVHMLVRKSFELNELKDSYRIRITADDYYKLYINGKFVCHNRVSS